MKIGFFLCVLLFPSVLLCQTVKLDSVEIYGTKNIATTHISVIDSSVLKYSATENLGDLLQKSSSINVNANGFFGQASSPSVGGLGSDHVKIHWEGIELNQLTLGSFDLSLFPSFLAGSVSINSASNFNTINTGALGAGVNIGSTTSLKNNFSLGFGSFNYRTASLQIVEKIGKSTLSIRPYIIYGDNNFDYSEKRPRELITKKSTHNALQQQGLEGNLKISEKVEIGVWTQSRSKQLPAALNQNKASKAIQNDKNARTYLRFTPNLNWQLQADYSKDFLSYRDKLGNENAYSINSEIDIQRYSINNRYREYIGPVKLQVENQFLLYQVNSTGFSNKISQWRSNQQLSAFYKKNKFFTQYSTKFIAAEGSKSRLTNSIAVGVQKNNYSLSYGIGQRFKLPDFNDLYWAQGGNPNLKNEEGYSQHLLFTLDKNYHLELKSTYTELKNKIQWVPGPQYWSPINIGQLRSISFDAKAEKIQRFGNKKINITAFANYCRAQVFNEKTETYNKELVPYLPAYKFGASASTFIKKTSLFISTYYQSERFTDFDNQAIFALKPYLNVDLGLRHELQLGNIPLELNFKINNLLNNKELLALARPNPGRYFRLTAIFSID